ncbi:MAG: hypothetical protein LBQ61_02355 [Spirochaetales bacterium]|jgi:hypothetical protein|nr:hypothetical protein [Spirochaetales bacterium]
MRGVIYATRITTNTLKKEQTAKILEIWIEDLQICINQNNEFFRSSAPRMAFNHFGTFEVPDDFCRSVEELVKNRESLETSNGKLFGVMLKKFKF